MSDTRLERMLHELGREVEFPETPTIAFTVAHRLTEDPLAPPATHRPRWLRPVLVAAAAIAITFGTLAFSPGARRAVADLLGVLGIRITSGTPSPTAPALDELELGRSVGVHEAEAAVGFQVRGHHALKGPWRMYLDRSIGDGGMVSTVFYPSRQPNRIEFLITEFRAGVDEIFLKKVAPGGTDVEFVRIGSVQGYWLSGQPHEFHYVDASGNVRPESVRLAGNVLLWAEDGITYRIEGAGDLRQAVQIAGTIRSAGA